MQDNKTDTNSSLYGRLRWAWDELIDSPEREEVMALSEAFLAWEQQKESQTRQSIALNMLRDNLLMEQIARLTGLTIDQLQRLQAEQA